MKKRIEVRSQVEFNACVEAGNIANIKREEMKTNIIVYYPLDQFEEEEEE